MQSCLMGQFLAFGLLGSTQSGCDRQSVNETEIMVNRLSRVHAA
jgi:hypothetical protein